MGIYRRILLIGVSFTYFFLAARARLLLDALIFLDRLGSDGRGGFRRVV